MRNNFVKIKGYDYSVNRHGVVMSLERTISYKKNGRVIRYLKPAMKKAVMKNNKGYYYVSIYKNNIGYNKLLHRLIAEAFIPNPQNKPEVNHKDGNPLNNNISNLEWATRKENAQHAHDSGLIIMPKGNKSPLRKAILQMDLSGKVIKRWDCIRAAARKLKVNHYCIVNVCAGRDNTYKGYKWKYAA